jgi:hypothetical protein
MQTPNQLPRCLAHGCNKPDQCARHVAIRDRQAPAMDAPISENACSEGLYFIPLETAKK